MNYEPVHYEKTPEGKEAIRKYELVKQARRSRQMRMIKDTVKVVGAGSAILLLLDRIFS